MLDVAGDELQGGVGVGGAALVQERDPGAEVGGCLVVGDHGVVVGPPGQAAGLVADLHVVGAGPVGPDLPGERRLGDEPAGRLGQLDLDDVRAERDDPDRLAGRRAAEHEPALVAVAGRLLRQQGGRQGGPPAVRRLAVDRDRLAQIRLQEPVRADEVVLEALLEDGRRVGGRQGAEGDGRRVDRRGDAGEADLVLRAVELDRADLADDPVAGGRRRGEAVGVSLPPEADELPGVEPGRVGGAVDGQRETGGVVGRGGRGDDEQEGGWHKHRAPRVAGRGPGRPIRDRAVGPGSASLLPTRADVPIFAIAAGPGNAGRGPRTQAGRGFPGPRRCVSLGGFGSERGTASRADRDGKDRNRGAHRSSAPG